MTSVGQAADQQYREWLPITRLVTRSPQPASNGKVRLIIDNYPDLQTFWATGRGVPFSSRPHGPVPPDIDFDSKILIIVGGMYSDTGHELRVDRVVGLEDKLVVSVLQLDHEYGGATFTYISDMVVVPRPQYWPVEVHFDERRFIDRRYFDRIQRKLQELQSKPQVLE